MSVGLAREESSVNPLVAVRRWENRLQLLFPSTFLFFLGNGELLKRDSVISGECVYSEVSVHYRTGVEGNETLRLARCVNLKCRCVRIKQGPGTIERK